MHLGFYKIIGRDGKLVHSRVSTILPMTVVQASLSMGASLMEEVGGRACQEQRQALVTSGAYYKLWSKYLKAAVSWTPFNSLRTNSDWTPKTLLRKTPMTPDRDSPIGNRQKPKEDASVPFLPARCSANASNWKNLICIRTL